jgi:hypothetical protein
VRSSCRRVPACQRCISTPTPCVTLARCAYWRSLTTGAVATGAAAAALSPLAPPPPPALSPRPAPLPPLARRTGHPGSARGAGDACRASIPCHVGHQLVRFCYPMVIISTAVLSFEVLRMCLYFASGSEVVCHCREPLPRPVAFRVGRAEVVCCLCGQPQSTLNCNPLVASKPLCLSLCRQIHPGARASRWARRAATSAPLRTR